MTLSYYCQFVIYPAKVVVKTESESDDDFNLSNVKTPQRDKAGKTPNGGFMFDSIGVQALI